MASTLRSFRVESSSFAWVSSGSGRAALIKSETRMRGRIGKRIEGQGHLAYVPLASQEELGESPIWPTLAVLGAAVLYATLPTGFVAGRSGAGVYTVVRWVVPGLAVLLLIPLLLTVPERPLLRSFAVRAQAHRVSRRILSLAVIAILTAANAAAIILLVHLLLTGAQTQASQLLRATGSKAFVVVPGLSGELRLVRAERDAGEQ